MFFTVSIVRVSPLSEVETAILSHPDVREVVVLTFADNQGDQTLCLYVVSHYKLDDQELRIFLTQKLPTYMIPSYFIFVDKIPLTSNGKVDRTMLPQPQEVKKKEGYIAPRNKTEAKVAQIWQEVLGVARVGVTDHFFLLGGHSLNALKLIRRISQEWGIDAPLALLFQSPTIQAIASYLDSEGNSPSSHQLPLYPEVVTFHADQDPSIFLFPPVLGYGMMYNQLASHMKEYRLHAFDFIEGEDRIGQFLEMIMQIEPTEALVLVGFSAGGGLAFEVTKELERRGRSVSQLILIDSYCKTTALTQQADELEETVRSIMEANQDIMSAYFDIEMIREGIMNKTKAYHRYYDQMINAGKVTAPIFLLRSKGTLTLPNGVNTWSEATTSFYEEHQGVGQHEEMLQAFANQNAQLLMQILAKVF